MFPDGSAYKGLDFLGGITVASLNSSGLSSLVEPFESYRDDFKQIFYELMRALEKYFLMDLIHIQLLVIST